VFDRHEVTMTMQYCLFMFFVCSSVVTVLFPVVLNLLYPNYRFTMSAVMMRLFRDLGRYKARKRRFGSDTALIPIILGREEPVDIGSTLEQIESERNYFTMTLEQLAEMNGNDPDTPMYISVKDLIFDVSAGREIYGPGKSYHALVGRNATLAFANACFATGEVTDQGDGDGAGNGKGSTADIENENEHEINQALPGGGSMETAESTVSAPAVTSPSTSAASRVGTGGAMVNGEREENGELLVAATEIDSVDDHSTIDHDAPAQQQEEVEDQQTVGFDCFTNTDGLTQADLDDVARWVEFYATHDKYKYVGKLIPNPVDVIVDKM